VINEAFPWQICSREKTFLTPNWLFHANGVWGQWSKELLNEISNIEPKNIEPKNIEQKNIEPKNIERKNIQPKNIDQKNIDQKSIEW
jgi:hypothetical protein